MSATSILVAQHRAIEGLLDDAGRGGIRAMRNRSISRLVEELVAHIAVETAVFYPGVRRLADNRLDAKALEHDENLMLRVELRRLLGSRTGDPSHHQCIQALRALFALHAKEEETKRFPQVERMLSRTELAALGLELEACRPPIWVVTSEATPGGTPRDDFASGGGLALRSRVSLPIPPAR